MSRILLVDDDLLGLESMKKLLQFERHEVVTCTNGQEGIETFKQAGKVTPFDLVITDVRMPKLSGLEFLRALSSQTSSCPVILMTAFGRVEDAVWAMKMGASDFLAKPFNRQSLVKAVNAALKRAKGTGGSEAQMLSGEAEGIRLLRAQISAVAKSDATVLIQGESGTGKERVARLLHSQGERANGPFVAINCGSIPEHLIESELFGHEKGSFTGAQSTKTGLIEAADGGTLFLDEIGDMPLLLQTKLLRVLQEGEIRRVGATDSRKINLRVVSATHRDLRQSVGQGTFREDLLFRLEVISLRVPPLRERTSDIPILIEELITQFNRRHGKAVQALDRAAMQVLLNHTWPGNVRELSNVIERAVVFAAGEVITVADLPEPLLELVGILPPTSHETITIRVGTPLKEIEDLLIQKTLEFTDGDKNRTAELLGINSRTIYRRLNQKSE